MNLEIRLTLACMACAACSSSSSSTGGNTGVTTACDPIAGKSTTLGTVLGVGQDTQATIYVADTVPVSGASGPQSRVFVASGKALVRQDVLGSGFLGGANASDEWSFEPPGGDAAATKTLFLQASGGMATGMQLVAGATKGAPPTSPSSMLTLLGASAVAGFAAQDLPPAVDTVADVSNGDALVITFPGDPYSASDARLFYGAPAQMIERAITGYNVDCCERIVSFDAGSGSATVHFTFNGDPDAGATGPGPATLTLDGATLNVTVRTPTPTTLSGFSFQCQG